MKLRCILVIFCLLFAQVPARAQVTPRRPLEKLENLAVLGAVAGGVLGGLVGWGLAGVTLAAAPWLVGGIVVGAALFHGFQLVSNWMSADAFARMGGRDTAAPPTGLLGVTMAR